MSQEFYYKISPDGLYEFWEGETKLDEYEEVFVCFDLCLDNLEANPVLLKYGRPEIVQRWYEAATRAYAHANLSHLCSDFRVYRGKFPENSLNRLLENSTSGDIFLKENGFRRE